MIQKLAIVYRPISALKPYPRNARTHSQAQVEQIAASIAEYGFTNPVLIDEQGEIIAGHGRIEAAKRMGLEQVPTITLDGLTKQQKRAYVLADNRIALNAGWDSKLLAEELAALKIDGFDLSLTGFDQSELISFMANLEPKGDPEDVPEVQDRPVTKAGDVWILGNHRIICGDSTDAATVERLLAGAKPHLMVTDPPYGVEYDANWRNEAMPQKNDPMRWKDGTGSPTGAVLNDDRADWSEAWALFPGDVAYVWHAGNMAHVVADSLLAAGLQIRAQIIWAKHQFVIGRGHYHPHHEPCWYAVRKGATGHWIGDRKQSTLWQIDKPQKSETGHSTQKPVECMKRPIENNSKAGDAVYEPFSGSGTTIIAAEMTARRCYAIELNPAYVDVAVRRWQQFTGKPAVLEGSGASFDSVAQDRLAEAA